MLVEQLFDLGADALYNREIVVFLLWLGCCRSRHCQSADRKEAGRI